MATGLTCMACDLYFVHFQIRSVGEQPARVGEYLAMMPFS